MCRIFSSLFLLWAITNSGQSINQPVFGLNEINSTEEGVTDLEKQVQSVSGRGDTLSHHLWSAAAALFITSLLAASFTALKIFVAQTLLVSKMSLAGAALLATKAAYDHLKHKFQNSKPLSLDSHPSEVFVTPWAWEHVPLTAPQQEVLPLPEGQEELDIPEDVMPSRSSKTRTHVGLPSGDHDASVRSDRLKQRYPPNLSVEYDTIIKKTTYLD